MSKNLSLSQNTSRDAAFHLFQVKPNNILSGNTQPYGSPTIEETQKGVKYPNVQAAIDDVVAMYTRPKNAIEITVDGVSPAGSAQVDEFHFTGVLRVQGKPNGTPVNFNFYGFTAQALVGDTGEEVAGKVKRQLEIAQNDNFVINNIVFGASLDILQVKYNDYQEHVLAPLMQYGVGVTQTIVSPAKPGYGVWTRIGTQTIQLDGATEPTILYYFKRED